jgi:hypothetical protein
MLISIDDIRKKQRKTIIKKVMYLKKKFKYEKKYFLTITFKDFEQYIKFDLQDKKKMFDNLVKSYGMKAGFLVVEPQKRGVPHIHMIIWMPKRLFLDKQFSGLYNIGMTNIVKIRNKQVVYYLLKYCLKEQERDIIKYRRKQRFITFYYKGKRKDKRWILLSLTGVNKILREYEIKKNRIAGYTYVNINGSVIKYKIYTSFKEDGLHIKDVYLYDFKENREYWLLDFRDYMEFLEWFECLIMVKLNLN